MLVISLRDFREKQSFFLEKVMNGENILLRNRKNQCFKLVPVTDDEMLVSKEEYYSLLDKSLEQIKNGESVACENAADLDILFKNIEKEVRDDEDRIF